MILRRAAGFAGLIVLVLAGNAMAQVPMMGNLPSFDSAPPAPPPGAGAPSMPAEPGPGPGAAPGGPPPGAAAQEPPCFREFSPLREAAEKRASLIKTAAERKAPRPEVCQLFKNFAAAEAKVIKFVVDNQASCHIPPQAVSQMKANHDRTNQTKDRVCAGGPGGEGTGAPPAPRLSDELGVRSFAEPNSHNRGTTFETLTGSPFGR